MIEHVFDVGPAAGDKGGRVNALHALLAANGYRTDAGSTFGAATEAAVSAWDGKLVARFLHWDARLLRTDLVRFLEAWRGRSLPRPWSC